MLRRDALLAGAALSLALHALLALMLVGLPSAGEVALARPLAPYDVEVEAEGVETGTRGAERRGNAPADADRPVPGGARSAQNIDARDRGEGGDVRGAADAILLMHRADGVVLFDSPLNNLAAAQSQRIRTARDRATREMRRATPNPHDEVFLASGPGAHAERRPVSARDSAPGARTAPIASVEGALPSQERAGIASASGRSGYGARPGQAAADRASPASADEAGTERASPGTGILGGEGTRRSEAARVATARPSVDEGPAATQAEVRDPRVRDRIDAELLASSTLGSWVESTTRSAPREGPGRGGVGGGGAPGSGGGLREGGRAAAHGPGHGAYDALDTSDDRYRRWFLAQRRRVQDALRFPRERALAMDQGVSIYRVTVRRDGTLVGEPEPLRSSGFPDMDRAAVAAIRAATPFAPLPDDLAPGLDRIRIRLPIEFSNPMVR